MIDAALTRSPVRIALVASLALNLLLIAVVGGQQLRRLVAGFPVDEPVGFWSEDGSPTPAVAQILAALPTGDAALLREAIAAHREQLAGIRAEFARAMQGVRAEIARTPADAERLREAIETARRARQAFGPILQAILLAAVPRMSEQGRQVLSQYRLSG
jgi:uncharacterized membrane protein